MTASTLPTGKTQFFSATGAALSNGKVYFYSPGTTTPVNTWKDAAQTQLNTNPVLLDAAGQALIYGTNTYRQVVQDVNGNTIWDQLVTAPAPAATLAQTIANIATLRAANTLTLPATSVQTVGYYSTSTTSAPDGGGGVYNYDSTDITSVDNGGTIIVDVANRRWKLFVIDGYINAKQFGAKGDGVTDDSVAIQTALNYLTANGGGTLLLPPGNYIATVPLVMYQSITVQGAGINATKITKTTTTVGTTASSLARGGTKTDSYATDDIIQVYHADNVYAYYVGVKDLTLAKATYAANSGGIYAPRSSQGRFENVLILNVTKGFRTYDTWMTTLKHVTCQAISQGFNWLDDGSGLGTGTSVHLEDCWNNFDNTVVQPLNGYNIFGLSYSTLTSCGADNANRTDTSAPTVYLFNTCKGITLTACGAENSQATILFVSGGSVTTVGFRTYQITGVATGTTAYVFADAAGYLTMINSNFDSLTSAGATFNWIIQNGAIVYDISPMASPAGGASFISYSASASKTVLSAPGQGLTGSLTGAVAGTGTFTPVLSGSSTAGAGTYTAQLGKYKRIDKQVFYTIDLVWTAHTGTGNCVLTGLPFTSTNDVYLNPANIITTGLTYTANNYPVAYVDVNTTGVTLLQVPTGGGAYTSVPITNSGSIRINGSYQSQ